MDYRGSRVQEPNLIFWSDNSLCNFYTLPNLLKYKNIKSKLMAKRDFDFEVYFWSFMPLHTYTVYIVQLKEIQCECEKSNTYVCKSKIQKKSQNPADLEGYAFLFISK